MDEERDETMKDDDIKTENGGLPAADLGDADSDDSDSDADDASQDADADDA